MEFQQNMKLQISKKPKTPQGKVVKNLLEEYMSEYDITSPIVDVKFHESYEEYRREYDVKLLVYCKFLNTMSLKDVYGQSIIFGVNPWFPQDNDEIYFIEKNLSKFKYYESLEGIANLVLSQLEFMNKSGYTMLDHVFQNVFEKEKEIQFEVNSKNYALRKAVSISPYGILMFEYENLKSSKKIKNNNLKELHNESVFKMIYDSMAHIFLLKSPLGDSYVKLLERIRKGDKELDENIAQFEGIVFDL